MNKTNLQCCLIILLLLAVADNIMNAAFAKDYYVDAALGNDAWSGDFSNPQPAGCFGAACTNGAWQSLSNVKQGGFLAGDNILLRCGQMWRDTLSVLDSGVANTPVSFSSYGSGCALSPPIVSGSNLIQNWSADVNQANVYVADVSGSISQVFVDGQYLKLAQYPNTGYLLIDADSGTVLSPGCIEQATVRPGNCFLQDADLSGQTDLIGSGIHIRTINWRIEDRNVVNFDPQTNTLFWDVETNYEIKTNYGYYLDNKRWMLDVPGEWYHDPVLGKLYLWLPDGSNPDQHVVEASVRSNAFIAQNVSNISVSNISFSQASGNGVYLSSVTDFLLDSIVISDSGDSGVYAGVNSLGLVQNSLVQRSVRDGISVSYSPGVSVLNNQVIDSGTVGSPKNSIAAIRGRASDNLTIQGNQITNAGYIGISFGRDVVIKNNIIRNVCLVLDDCGALYTSGRIYPSQLYNSTIDSNIIIDVIGNVEGRPGGQTLAMGIYLDDLSSGITVTNNTVVNADRGIELHNSNNDWVSNNTLFNNRFYELSMNEDTAAGDISANTINNNIIFPLTYQEDPIRLRSRFDNNSFASYDNNRYSLIHSNFVATERYVPAGGTLTTRYDFSAWQGKFDNNAKAIAPFSLAQGLLDPGAPENFINNSDFITGTVGWKFWPPNSSLVLQADCGWDGACVSYRASIDILGSLLISNPLSLVQGKSYVVEFAARGEFNNQFFNAIVRRSEPGNFETVGLNKPVVIDTQWSHHRLTFTATKTLTTARLEFNPLLGEAVEFDDIRMFEVLENDPSDDVRIVINESSVSQSLPCPDVGTLKEPRCGEYIDINSMPVTWPTTVPAFGSKIIIWAGNPYQDSDFDTLADLDDNCPSVGNSSQKDLDQDNYGDACDAFPSDPTEWLDTDNDGIGNNADLDDDGDGLLDINETNTGVYSSPVDTGTNPLVADTDGDGVNDGLEVAAGTDPLNNASFPVLNDGDVNNNGQVNVADLVIAMQILTGQKVATPLELAHLDVGPLVGGIPSPDGLYNLGDYLVLLRKVTGMINF